MLGEVPIFEFGLMIITLAIGASIASHFKKSDIPVFILSGIILGPYGIGRISSFYVGSTTGAEHFIEIGAELGVIFLLFFMGLSFSLKKFKKHSGRIATVGTIDLLNFAPGLLVGYLFFQDIMVAFLIGGIVYISSSAVISKSLMDLGWESTPEADTMLGGLVFEDLAIVVYLAVLSAVLLTEETSITTIFQQIGIAMLFVVILLMVIYTKPQYFDRLLDTDSTEIFVLRAVGFIGLITGTAMLLGLSEAIAAFFVGLAFGGTEHMAKLQQALYSFRYLFGGIFFFWIGMRTDPMLIRGILPILILAVIGSSIYKFFTAYYSAKHFKMDILSSRKVGVGMITRGEFSLIIAAISAEAVGRYAVPNITEIVPAFAVSYVLVMTILGTILMQLMDR